MLGAKPTFITREKDKNQSHSGFIMTYNDNRRTVMMTDASRRVCFILDRERFGF